MEEVVPSAPSEERPKPRGPAMLLVLFLSLFISSPGWAQPQLSEGPAKVDRLDARTGAWTARPQTVLLKAKKAPEPAGPVPTRLGIVTSFTQRDASAPAPRIRFARSDSPRFPYRARAPPAA